MHWLFDHLSASSSGSLYWVAGILMLCGLGLPIPEDLSLISAGYLAHRGEANVHTAFVVCFAAVLAGDTLAFALGKLFGTRVLESRLFKRLLTPRKQLRVRAYFRKYGSKVIFVGRFLPGLRFTIFFSAGVVNVRTAVFLIYDTLAAVLSVPTLVYLAWYFGSRIDHVASWARRSEYGILVVVLVVVALLGIKTYRLRRKRRILLAADAPVVTVGAKLPPAAPKPPASLRN